MQRYTRNILSERVPTEKIKKFLGLRDKRQIFRVVISNGERLKRNVSEGVKTMKGKIKSILISALCATVAVCSLTACSAGPGYMDGSSSMRPGSMVPEGEPDNYQTEAVREQDFVNAAVQPDSYFSLDRNTASYTYMRKLINDGHKVSDSSVRLEEYINYFTYDYVRPDDGAALALSGTVFDCPWNAEHKLMTVGVAAEEVRYSDIANNIVFLIDTSGSMYGDDRLGLIQQSFSMLVENLDASDTVSIVTYAGDSRTALAGASGAQKTLIANVLQDLRANGSTNGQGGIQRAYGVARQYFKQGANNRVILATDGDFNVGASDKHSLESLIRQERESGVYLTVLGVGMHNTNDTTMKTLAENGNGNYAYLDSVGEARKVLVNELGGTFNVVAKDAKMGVTFNPETVDKYRLIGYETKRMSQEEFDDPDKDAGEIGSGHTVTAVYEIALRGDAEGNNIATCKVRYKVPETDGSDSVQKIVTFDDMTDAPNEDCVFIGCVTEFGLLLRQSKYAYDASFGAVMERLNGLNCTGSYGDPFKAEFKTIVTKAMRLYE